MSDAGGPHGAAAAPTPGGEVRTVGLPGGRTLAYAEYGAPDGAPVLYCHGGLSSHSDVAFAGPAAAQRGVRLVAPDRPGIGSSGRCRGRTVADWAGDVAVLADHLGLDGFSALGWSAGGPFALALAAGLGARVRAVALVGGMAPLEPPLSAADLGLAADRRLFPLAGRSPGRAAATLWLLAHLPRRVVFRQMARGLPSAADRAVVGAMTLHQATDDLRGAAAHGVGGLVDDYAVAGGSWGFRPEDVAAPVTLFQGAEDTLVPMAHAEHLAGRLPQGRLVVVPGAGHFLLHTHLDDVLGALAG